MFRIVNPFLFIAFLVSCGHNELSVRTPSFAPVYPEVDRRSELTSMGDYLQIDWTENPVRVALVVHSVDTKGLTCCGSPLDLMPEAVGNQFRYRVPDNVAANFNELWMSPTGKYLFAIRVTPPDTRMAFRVYKLPLVEFAENRMLPLYRIDFRHIFACTGSGCL